MTVTFNWAARPAFTTWTARSSVPARQTYIERTTVLKAIASAGGFTDFAKKNEGEV